MITAFQQRADQTRMRSFELDGCRVVVEPPPYEDARGASVAEELARARARVASLEAEVRRLRLDERFTFETFDGEKLIYFAQSERIELADGRLVGKAEPHTAFAFLHEAALFALVELPALFAAALQVMGEGGSRLPGDMRRMARTLLRDEP